MVNLSLQADDPVRSRSAALCEAPGERGYSDRRVRRDGRCTAPQRAHGPRAVGVADAHRTSDSAARSRAQDQIGSEHVGIDDDGCPGMPGRSPPRGWRGTAPSSSSRSLITSPRGEARGQGAAKELLFREFEGSGYLGASRLSEHGDSRPPGSSDHIEAAAGHSRSPGASDIDEVQPSLTAGLGRRYVSSGPACPRSISLSAASPEVPSIAPIAPQLWPSSRALSTALRSSSSTAALGRRTSGSFAKWRHRAQSHHRGRGPRNASPSDRPDA